MAGAYGGTAGKKKVLFIRHTFLSTLTLFLFFFLRFHTHSSSSDLYHPTRSSTASHCCLAKEAHTLSLMIVYDVVEPYDVFKILMLCLTAPSAEVQVPLITSVMATKEASSIMLLCGQPPLACFFHEQMGFEMCPQLIVALAAVFHSRLFRSIENFRSSAHLGTLRQDPAAIGCGNDPR